MLECLRLCLRRHSAKARSVLLDRLADCRYGQLGAVEPWTGPPPWQLLPWVRPSGHLPCAAANLGSEPTMLAARGTTLQGLVRRRRRSGTPGPKPRRARPPPAQGRRFCSISLSLSGPCAISLSLLRPCVHTVCMSTLALPAVGAGHLRRLSERHGKGAGTSGRMHAAMCQPPPTPTPPARPQSTLAARRSASECPSSGRTAAR